MDKTLMKEFYFRFYGEKTQEIISQHEKYENIINDIRKQESELASASGDDKKSIWNAYEKIIDVYWDMLDLAAEVMYLKGAEDRDRMLR